MNILLQLMHDTMGKTARIKGCVNLLQQGCLPKIDEIKLLEIIETSAEELNNVLDAHYIECKEDNTEKKYTIKEVEKYHDIRATQGISNANKYIESLNK